MKTYSTTIFSEHHPVVKTSDAPSRKLTVLLEVVISPPALYLLLTRQNLRKDIEVAAQNVFHKPNGAFTGEISVEQLKESDIKWTILGHSERRVVMEENDEVIPFSSQLHTDKDRRLTTMSSG